MSTALKIYANVGTQDSEVGVSGASWQELDTDNDRFIFSAGSDSVKDGEPSPSDTQLNQAGIVLTGAQITIDKYFLDDVSANELKEIANMGADNKRYVLGFSFDGATASEPVLEIWDDSDLDTVASAILGSGTPSSSFVYGIATTDALPGVAWTGSRIAGSSDGHFLWLNNENGALTVADVLYCQLKIVIPASQTDSISATPVIAVKYATT